MSTSHLVDASSTAAEPGMSSAEARRRLAEHGGNEWTSGRPLGGIRQLLHLFADPLVVILVVAAAVSMVVGERVGAVIIIVVVLLGVVINFVQTYRSRHAIERLREGVAPTATVRRDGAWQEVPRRDVVPGDCIRLSAGDLVPADAELLEARDLHVQQATLTGESLPVEKEPGPAGPGPHNPTEARHVVFLGTSVVSGAATARVLATGRATAFGEIAARLAARPPETEFDRGTRRIGAFITRVILLLVAFMFLVTAVLGRPPLESLLFAVALAVGLTPEFLPMIVAVTLARGAVRMARRKVVVKHLAAMQNFGSIDILCSDKTGTLTSGAMALDRSLDAFGNLCPEIHRLAYLNSFHETGIKSPLDAAILGRPCPGADTGRKLDEVPFDFERRRLSVVVALGDERLLITKGASEGVLSQCTQLEQEGQPRPLDAATRARCVETFQRLSGEGFRLLAVAYRRVPLQDAYRAVDEKDLVLAGFITFVDPPIPDATAALRALHRDGVQVKILTGDNEQVARHVCGQVGLDASALVLGAELDRMTDAALGHVAEQTTVFARVSPAQKNRIIIALKGRSHVVGYLGDGINDAPSLHAADVGISVSQAVDVAREAAEIILLEPGLHVLHNGIVEGRRAFGNVMKYLLMGTSSNFGNMCSMAAAALFLPFLPMLPMQILLNSFLYDLSQLTIPTDNVDASFTRKPRRWDIGLLRTFMITIGPISSLYDLLTFGILLGVFHASAELFHTGWFVESLATQTLVLFVIRTGGNPFRSRPSRALALSVVLVVLTGLALPYSPLAEVLGFIPLPATLVLLLAVLTGTYLVLVEVVKRRLVRRLFT